MKHALTIPADNHTIYRWIVADTAALNAIVPILADVGKVAWVQDTNDFKVLLTHSPVTWKSIGSNAVDFETSIGIISSIQVKATVNRSEQGTTVTSSPALAASLSALTGTPYGMLLKSASRSIAAGLVQSRESNLGTTRVTTAGSKMGFKYSFIGGMSEGLTTANNRFFMGLRSTAGAVTDVDPSTLTGIIGIGWDTADTQIQFMYNNASGTATKVSTGMNIPSADQTEVYKLIMSSTADETNSPVHLDVYSMQMNTLVNEWVLRASLTITGLDAKLMPSGTMFCHHTYGSSTVGPIAIIVGSLFIDNTYPRSV